MDILSNIVLNLCTVFYIYMFIRGANKYTDSWLVDNILVSVFFYD